MDNFERQRNSSFHNSHHFTKRLMMILFLLIILAVTLTACTIRFPNSTNKQKSTYSAEIKPMTGFKLETDQTEYGSQVQQFEFTIYNDSNYDASFGAAYELDVLQNGTWYAVPFKGIKGDTQPTWPAIVYMLPAHGTATGAISLSSHDEVVPGRYRLIKEVGLNFFSQQPMVLATQFTISETNQSKSTTTQTTTVVPTTKATTTLTSTKKPAIYLYPEKQTTVQVALNYHGQLTCTYPAYDEGWHVTAYPDGTLINHADGRQYSYLYWEGLTDTHYDCSKGFVVQGQNTAAFLQEKLNYLGLTPKEYNEFIVYWLPQMQDNPYNLITFQSAAYTDNAVLTITPKPDSMLRVFMAYKPLQQPMVIEEQILTPFERKGFVVTEWGGSCIN